MFDRYAAQTAPSWGRRALFLAAILLHVSAGIALAIYSIFHIEEIAPPAIALTLFSAPPPPPPPPPKKHHHSETKKVEIKKPDLVQPKPDAVFQPKKQEEKPEEKDEPDEPGATDDGVEGGKAGGVKGGTLGGVVGSTGPARPTPKTVPMFTLMSQKIAAVNPHLSDGFKQAHPHQQAIGSYKVCIGNDGHVTDVDTMNSIAGEDGPIVNQIKSTWLYKPQPVPVCFVSRLVFQIP